AVVFDGGSYSTSTSSFNASYPGLLGTKTDNGAPKAYLNWLIFDRNYVSLTGGFKQITTAGKEAGTDVAHELVTSPTINITEAGYAYIWLSNENATPVEVYFDDFKVTQTKSPVVATNDYYAFGLTFNSYPRENSTQQNYLYNGKELQDELNVGWLDYGARMYMPEIGRWGVVDPLSEKSRRWSPYNYTMDNPIRYIDPDGREVVGSDGKAVTYERKDGKVIWSKNATADIMKIGNSMLSTKKGEKSFQSWQSMSTKVNIKIDKETKSKDLAQTTPTQDANSNAVKNKDGHYAETTVTFFDKTIQANMAEGSGKRLENASEEEAYGTVGVHEEAHHEPGQIKQDNKESDEFKQDRKKTGPLNGEIKFRNQYHAANPGLKNENTWKNNYQILGFDTNQSDD
ncbi:MAG: RHS repeat-associated core domain-containing protein, partial [Bacteroidetes bacterium]|nr:RHS repeat-associated core domain-containing protein [Bacteroidota bacterium]